MTGDNTADAFEQFSNEIATHALKARRRAADKRAETRAQSQPMVLTPLEKSLAETSGQLKAYRAAKRQDIRRHLAERYPDDFRTLSRLLRNLNLDNPDALIDHVRQAQWLLRADLETRRTALSVIAGAIIRLRLINGYPPMDDSLPGEDPTAFEIIRDLLKVIT